MHLQQRYSRNTVYRRVYYSDTAKRDPFRFFCENASRLVESACTASRLSGAGPLRGLVARVLGKYTYAECTVSQPRLCKINS